MLGNRKQVRRGENMRAMKKCSSTDCISENLNEKPIFKRNKFVCERCLDYSEGWT